MAITLEWMPARTLKRYFCHDCGGECKLLVKGFSYILLCKTCKLIDLDVREAA